MHWGCRSGTWEPGGSGHSDLSQSVFEKVELAGLIARLALGLSVSSSVGSSLKTAALGCAGRGLGRKVFVPLLLIGSDQPVGKVQPMGEALAKLQEHH